MKIIGRTQDGLIVEITENEIARACGFDYHNSGPWQEHTKEARERTGYGGGLGNLKIGSTINVSDVHAWFGEVRDRETKAIAGARALTDLAAMITVGLPTVIIPPPEPKKGPDDGQS